MVYYTSTGGHDFELQPGADPSRIAMRFAAAWSLSVDVHDGSLTASHPDWGSLTLPRPVIYQPASSASIDGGYSLTDNVVGFWLGDYDAALPLVIDPLVFSTYLGGSLSETGYSVAVDSADNIIVAGIFPTTDGSLNSGSVDVFVSKFSDSGALLFSTRFGGLAVDNAYGVAVDSAGNVFCSSLS